MANLLSLEYKRKIRRRAIYKLLIVYILGFTTVLILASVFLTPSYMLAESKRLTAEKNLELLKTSISAKQNEEFEKTLKETTQKLQVLDVPPTKKFYEVVGLLVDARTEGLSFNAINFRDASGNVGVYNLQLSGFAPSRETLLQFRNNLKEVPIFSNVNLPISVLARDRDIDFSMQLEVDTKLQ